MPPVRALCQRSYGESALNFHNIWDFLIFFILFHYVGSYICKGVYNKQGILYVKIGQRSTTFLKPLDSTRRKWSQFVCILILNLVINNTLPHPWLLNSRHIFDAILGQYHSLIDVLLQGNESPKGVNCNSSHFLYCVDSLCHSWVVVYIWRWIKHTYRLGDISIDVWES